jgi:hypothetical protein
MNAQQLYDLLADLQDDGLNLSDIHLAYPSQNPGTVHERIEHTEIVQLPGSQVTEIVFMTVDDKKIYLELLNTEFAPVMVATQGEGAVIVEPVDDLINQLKQSEIY